MSPTSLAFAFQIGGATPASQTLSLSSNASSFNFTASAATTAGGNWLLANPTSGTTPASVSVSVNPAGLAAGTYNGTVTLTAAGATNSPVSVGVTLTISAAGQLSVSPSSLQFNFQIGGSTPAGQAVSVASTGGALNFSVSAATNNGGPWLVVGSTSGTTPTNVGISVNPLGLASGTYTGTVTITAPAAPNSPQTVAVTLNVSTNPLLNVSSGSLSFNFQVGTANPPNQNLTLTSTGSALSFTVSVTTTSGGPWLLVGMLSGATPTTVSVGVNPAGLATGTYNGSVTLTAPGAANNPQTVAITLTVSNSSLLNVGPASLSFAFQTGTATPPTQSASVTATGAPLSFTPAATTVSGGNWLAVTSSSGTTPATLVVSVNPTGLANGTYTGSVTVTAAGATNSPQTISVTLYVSNTALIVASPGALTFSSPVGGPIASVQTVSLTTTDGSALAFSIGTTTSAGGNWLLVGPVMGATPTNLSVTVNPAGLSVGTYSGAVVVTAPSVANSPQTVAIALTITPSATLVIAPTSLSFTQTTGGPGPASQTLAVSSSGAGLSFTAVASTSTGGNWLSVSSAAGTSPASLTISANGASLSPGSYSGTITISSSGAANSPQNVPVTLTVNPPQPIFITPAAVPFSFQIGGSPPAAQTLSISSNGGAAVSFTASAAVSGGGSWLSVSPSSGTTPGSVTISVNPAGLATGAYSGTVTITAPGASNSPQTANVTLTVTAAAVVPSIGGVVNAASFIPAAVSAGEIVSIFGTNVGPSTPVGLRLTANGFVDTSLGGTQVMFDGIAAPLTYVSGTQVNAIVPYEVASRVSTQVQVVFQGVASTAAAGVRVADTAPGIFSVNGTGSGQGAILNQDFSPNSAANPAQKGSFIMIYGTGEGQTTPPGVDGLITTNVLRKPLQGVTVTIGGVQAEVTYYGAAPTLVAGVIQVNAKIPQGIASGSAVPVVVMIGGVNSQTGITMAVQ